MWGAFRSAWSLEVACSYLVMSVELLVLPLTLPEGLPLGLQRLGQVGVLQALLGVLLRQHLDLPLEGAQLLPATNARKGTP